MYEQQHVNDWFGTDAEKKKGASQFAAGAKSGGLKIAENSKKTDKAAKRKENFKKAATIVSGLSDLAGHLKDPGLSYTPSATSVRSGASKGASYIGSFDEYNTEDAAGRK